MRERTTVRKTTTNILQTQIETKTDNNFKLQRWCLFLFMRTIMKSWELKLAKQEAPTKKEVNFLCMQCT